MDIRKIEGPEWATVASSLDAHGCAVVKNLLPAETCKAIAGLYEQEDLLRNRVVMARHSFWTGRISVF